MNIHIHSAPRIVRGFRVVPLLLLCSFFLLCRNIQAQPQITPLSPSKVTLRGISVADLSHSMCVGDSATIMLNLDTGTIYTTPTGGITFSRKWNELLPPVARSHTFYGVSYYDSLHAIVIGDGGLILRTTDQGSSWSQISKGLTNNSLRGIWQASAGSFVIVGDSGVILRSVDSGRSWNKLASGTLDTLFAVTFGSSRAGVAVGEKGTALKTSDGGLTWTAITGLVDPKINFYGVAMSGEDSAIVVGDSARIHYTNDGTNWKTAVHFNNYGQRVDHPIAAPLYGVAFSAIADVRQPRAIACGRGDVYYTLQQHGIFGVGNRDTTWVASPTQYAGDADGTIDSFAIRLRAVIVRHFGTSIVIQGVGENEQIQANANFNYQDVVPVNPANLNRSSFLAPLFVSFDSAGHGFATAIDGNIARSSDNGLHWTNVLYYSGKQISGIHCFDSNTAIVAGWDGYIYRTSDAGAHWITEPNTLVQDKLHAFAFPTHDIGVCVGDQGAILRTTDAGLSWKDVSVRQLPFLNSVAFSNMTTGVLIGQYATVRRTTDGGLTWGETPPTPLDGYLNANLRSIDAFTDGTYIIGSDSGVIKSIDQGKNWSLIAIPPCSIGSSFYNSKIGVIGEYTTTSAAVADAMVLKSTTDGGTSWSLPFSVPILNGNRLVIHWLDGHTFLLYGTRDFIVKIDLSGPNVVTKIISNDTHSLHVYPNPSHGSTVTIEYTIEKEGPVTVELLDDLGRQVSSLYAGTETAGEHSRTLVLPPDLQGSYIVSLLTGGKQRALKMVKF